MSPTIAEAIARHWYHLVSNPRDHERYSRYRHYVWDRYGKSPATIYFLFTSNQVHRI